LVACLLLKVSLPFDTPKTSVTNLYMIFLSF